MNINACRPAVTVVMAAYNAEAFIARAIKSVLEQTFWNWELICIDDGSKDNTQAIIRNFSERDARIKLLTQSNAGPAAARRQGYVVGEGDYFIILDSDDWFAPSTLEALVAEAKENLVDCVVCRAMIAVKGSNNYVSFHERCGTPQGSRFTGEEAFALTFPWRIHGIGLWRRSLIKNIAVQPSNAFNNFNADEYLTRKLFLSCQAVFVGSGEYYIYPNEESITRKMTWRHFMRLETDRRLSDLAINSPISVNIIKNVLDQQRRGIIMYTWRFARYGGEGRARLVMLELVKSVCHYIWSAAKTQRLGYGVTIILSIL
ncbi:glycosyltransferase family 2 protein, partial [Flavimaricola sp.]